MNLNSKQKSERAALERLVKSIKNRASNPDELAKVLHSFESFNDLDPMPHVIIAMENYLNEDKQ